MQYASKTFFNEKPWANCKQNIIIAALYSANVQSHYLF